MNYMPSSRKVSFSSFILHPSSLILHPSSLILELEARGGVEPRAFPPSSCRFGLEDRRRERGPGHCRFSIANCRLGLLINSALMRTLENDESAVGFKTNRQSAMFRGRGVRPTR